MGKRALLVVSFGSTVDSARETLNKVEKCISSQYPDCDLFCAYTSSMIRKRLSEKGISVSGPEEIFKKLTAEEYEEVIVSPTHLIPGVEFDRLSGLVNEYSNQLTIQLKHPLIYDQASMLRVIDSLNANWNFSRFAAENTAFLFMGHGTDHLANFIYPAMQTAFISQGHNNVFMATVEGWPTLADAMGLMKKGNYKKVFVAPFMLIAGVHAYEDMAGDSEDSWKNQLIAQGFEVTCSMEVVEDYLYK